MMLQMEFDLRDECEDQENELQRPSHLLLQIDASCSPKITSRLIEQPRFFYVSAEIRRKLCNIYLRNIDPVFKILHGPSLKSFLALGKPYLDYQTYHHAPDALAFAVYYATVCTMDESECHSLLNQDRKTTIAEFRAQTERKLERIFLLSKNDLTTLQAYVLSLLAGYCQGQSRHVWTKLSLAIRIGEGLFLNTSEPPFYVSPFDREMRCRIWQAIGVLDLATSLDQASEPMIQATWLKPPANVNDEQIWYNMKSPAREHPRSTFTDMTHTLIVAEAQVVARSTMFTENPQEVAKVMNFRQHSLRHFQREASLLLNKSEEWASPYQTYVKRTASTIHSWLRLGTLRPISQRPNILSSPIPTKWAINFAVDNIKKAQESYTDPLMAPWAWYGSLWAPWHGLAFALAQMCRCDDPVVFLQHWPVVHDAYELWRHAITDCHHGMLSGGLERLMHQAKSHRGILMDKNTLYGEFNLSNR